MFQLQKIEFFLDSEYNIDGGIDNLIYFCFDLYAVDDDEEVGDFEEIVVEVVLLV